MSKEISIDSRTITVIVGDGETKKFDLSLAEFGRIVLGIEQLATEHANFSIGEVKEICALHTKLAEIMRELFFVT
jgi:hypothetical protein